jgi:hypothetical protein
VSNGWIKLHRSLLDWEWYNDTNVTRLFLHLLLKANHKEKNWRGNTIKSGQLITGRKALSKETGLSEQQIRSSLDKLKSTNEITIQSTSRSSIITVVAWDSYQQINQELTSNQPTDNQQITTNKNVNNVRKEEVNNISPTGSGSKAPNVPFNEIVDLYMRILPELPVVKVINEERKRVLRATWKAHKNFQTLDFWERYFNQVRNIDWIMGRTGTTYAIDFTYLIKQKNVIGIVEGKH